MNTSTISVCIPVFNEAENVALAVSTVEEIFHSKLPQYLLEIIITDNASTDRTWELVTALSATRPHLKAFRFSRNFGYQNSVFAGLCLANGDAVVAVDADLEDPPNVIVQFVEKWREGFDVVYGVRQKRYGPIYLRFLFSLFYKSLTAIASLGIPENAGDFRLLDRKVVNVLKALPERNLYLRGLVWYLGFRQAPVPYDRQPRTAGTSKFGLRHYAAFAIDGVTAFSKAPLRLIGILGVCLFILSAVLGSYYFIGGLLRGTRLPGFTTIVVLLLFLHGLTFIFIGIIGEYLSRVFDDAKYRPRVIISDALNSPEFPAYF
jgi:glycosyltransferase involved in cell wall biosynthesis